MEDPSFNYRVILDHTDADIDDFFIKYYPIRDTETGDLIRPSTYEQKKIVIMEILMVVYSIVGFNKFTPFASDYCSVNSDDMLKYNNTYILTILDNFDHYSKLPENYKKCDYQWIRSSIVWCCSNIFCIFDDINRYSKNGINILKLLNINEEHYFDAVRTLDCLYNFYSNVISEEDKMSRHQYIPNKYYLDRVRCKRTKSARN